MRPLISALMILLYLQMLLMFGEEAKSPVEDFFGTLNNFRISFSVWEIFFVTLFKQIMFAVVDASATFSFSFPSLKNNPPTEMSERY